MAYYEPILDISKYQAPVDWDKMWDAGVRLVILRLTVGDYYKDTEFDNFYTNAKNRGFKVGAYHVVKPSISPIKQFQKIIASLPFELLDIPLTLDCELSDGLPPVTISDNIAALATSSFDLWKRYPLIYTRGEWWNSNTVSRPIFPKCKLFVARYTALPHPWNDAPALRPRDWTEWALWQHSADGNGEGEAHGVGSDDVDKDRSVVESLPATLALLNGNPPPDPTPTGEPPLLQFKALTTVNIRSSPAVISSPSNDVGNMPTGAIVTAWAMRLFAGGSFWARIEPLPAWLTTTANEYWIALEYKAGNVLVDYTPAAPIPYLVKTASGNTPLYYWKDKNTSQKPIMVKPPDPPKFLAGKQVIVDPGEVDTDGTENYYRVLNGALATPPALTPSAPWQGWYVKCSEVF